MANDDSLLREVDQGLAEDRQRASVEKNLPVFIGIGAAIVLGVTGWQLYLANKASVAADAASEYRSVLTTLRELPEEGRATLDQYATEAPGGYAALSNFRRAAMLAREGEQAKARDIYREIYRDNSLPSTIRDLARLRASLATLGEGREAVIAELGGLPNEDTRYGVHAREVAAISALRAGDYQTAESMFERLAIDPLSPEPLKFRAEELRALAIAAKAGVNISGEVRAEDLSELLGSAIGGEGGLELPSVGEDSHEGHDHGAEDEGAGHDHEAEEPEELNSGGETRSEESE